MALGEEIRVPETERLSETGSSVSWGAIFAGAFIALAVQIVFTLLGSAIGLSTFDPQQGETLEAGATTAFGIYFLITMIISFFVGGYCASRLAGFKFRTAAMLHGLSSWAVISVFLVYTVSYTITGAAGRIFSIASSGLKTAAGQISGESQILSEVLPQGNGQSQRAGDQGLSEEETAEILSQEFGISRAQARQLIDQIRARVGEVDPQQVAGQVTDVMAGTSWIAFLSLLLSAIGAMLGALAGAGTRRSIKAEAEPVKSRRPAA